MATNYDFDYLYTSESSEDEGSDYDMPSYYLASTCLEAHKMRQPRRRTENKRKTSYLVEVGGPAVPGGKAQSTSFEEFKAKLRDTTKTYKFLDPAQSRQFVKGKHNLDSSGMIMLQGALINTMAIWETYILHLLEEGFKSFIEVGSGDPPSLNSLEKYFPACMAILKKELKSEYQGIPPEEVGLKLLTSVNSQNGSTPWAHLFTAFCRNTTSRSQLVPVFSSGGGSNSIDLLFSKIFQTSGDFSLSEKLLEIGAFRFKIQLNKEEETEVQIDSVEALCNISRLYYALRCIFAHGQNQKTLQSALKDFPQSIEEFNLGNEKAAKYYLGLYRRIERYGRDASVSYLTFANMIQFLKRAAFFLMRAVARWVYEATEGRGCIWGYKPHP